MQVNKLLVKSCFENDSWIERIAANPVWERNRKMQNEAGNDAQHSKIHYAVKMKTENPSVDFEAFAKPSKGKKPAKRGSPTTQSTPNPTFERTSTIDSQGANRDPGDYSAYPIANGYGSGAKQPASMD